MIRIRPLLSLVTVLAVLSGGCPLGTDPNGGSSASSSGGSSSSGAGSILGSQDFQDQLAEQFPGCSEPADGDDWRDEILRLANLERERAGLLPLTQNQTLEDLATQYACEMIYYDFFDHEHAVTGSRPTDRATESGYDWLAFAENLAAGQPTPARAMADWMASEGHRENILSPQFTELGVGVRTGGQFQTYWVQEFGRPYDP